jgi:hypothetical protein
LEFVTIENCAVALALEGELDAHKVVDDVVSVE